MLLGVPKVGVTAVLVAGTAASCALGVLVAEGVVSPWVAVPLAGVPAGLALAYLLRLGIYSDDGRGRSQLVIRPSRAGSSGPPSPRPDGAPAGVTRSRVHIDRRTQHHTRPS
jgi:hypothetical protein